MKQLAFAYGKVSSTVRVPEGLAPPDSVLASRAPAPAAPAALLQEALEEARLEIEEPVAVVVPDETRPLDREAALGALAGPLGGRAVEVVVGAGLHPAAPLRTRWPTRVHDAHAPDLVPVGEADGIGVRLDPAVARAATVIVVSAVMPHYLAGFSGGPKGLVPGVAAEETVLALHARADQARPGDTESNPFFAAIRACAGLLSARVYGLNLLVGPRGPFAATAGRLEQAHARAVERYRAACSRPLPVPADVVVADAGGHPVDATLLQAHKAYATAALLARRDATIVLVASCDRGFGHPEFERRLFQDDPLAGPFHPYARTAAEWRRKARAYRTVMVTELETRGLEVERASLVDAVAAIPRGARVLWAQGAQDLLFDAERSP